MTASMSGSRVRSHDVVAAFHLRISASADRRSLVRLRAQRYGETSTKLEERSRGGGGQPCEPPAFAALDIF